MSTVNPFQDRIDRLRMDIASLEAGSRVANAPRIAELEQQITSIEGAVQLACPNCNGVEELADVTLYPGLCRGTFIKLPNDVLDFDGDGTTEVIWDAGKLAPDPVQCDSCGWVGKREQLVPFVDEDEVDEDSIQCEDCDVNGEDCRTHGVAVKAALDAARIQPEATLAALRAAGLAPAVNE